MREIKFRGKVVGTGEWVYGHYLYNMEHLIKTEEDTFSVVPETVGQYTGEKDSKYNEIYEGDNVAFGQAYQYTGTIMFEDGGFCTTQFHLDDVIRRCEVIGNIHE